MDKIIYILILLIITSLLGYYYKNRDIADFDVPEHFSDYTNVVFMNEVPKIYDPFYSSIYDSLFSSDIKNEFEIYNIVNYTIKDQKISNFEPKDIKFLDIGCGTGGHLKILSRDKYNMVGVDKSMDMLEKARLSLPNAQLIKGDFLNRSIFKKREFTHILCMFYTIYYTDTPDKIFSNVNYWLKPKGFFCLHLVNPGKFDTVLEKSSKLIPLYNPQKHSEKRVTKTKLKFNKFNYVADWKFTKQKSQFIENFMFHDNSKHRQNIHNLTMSPIKYYCKLAEKNGFKLVKIIDLLPVNHDNSYIYIFQKNYGM